MDQMRYELALYELQMQCLICVDTCLLYLRVWHCKACVVHLCEALHLGGGKSAGNTRKARYRQARSESYILTDLTASRIHMSNTQKQLQRSDLPSET